ncbi:hypothetical protein LB505_010324 [Fusarium chuoi]|nr:hypothetical protein LB505_010324 [Fusarium chuoi]
MVFFQSGGYIRNASPYVNGTQLVSASANNIIFVNFNYRVGILAVILSMSSSMVNLPVPDLWHFNSLHMVEKTTVFLLAPLLSRHSCRVSRARTIYSISMIESSTPQTVRMPTTR